MKRSIVWLASYPKSGNTWLRIFLANYLANPKEALKINDFQQFALGDSVRRLYEMVSGPTPVDLDDPKVTLGLRDKVLRGIVANNADVNLMKTHNFRGQAFGVDLIPRKYSRQAIYVVRNPLDVVLSYARHYGETAEFSVMAMGKSSHLGATNGSIVHEFYNDWSTHVKSWTNCSEFPVLVLRYEDLLSDPEGHFSKALDAIGVPVDEERLCRAVRFSGFDELKKQEEQDGFSERSEKSEAFFSKGQAGQWKTELPEELVARVRRDHKRMMKKFGYYNA